MADLTAGVKNQIGYNGGDGIAVQQVFSGSPADPAGIQPGDVILQADGKTFEQRQGPPQLHRLQEARRHDPAQRLVARHEEVRCHQA